MDQQEVREKLAAHAGAMRISMVSLAERIGIDAKALSRFMEGDAPINQDVVDRCAAYLQAVAREV